MASGETAPCLIAERALEQFIEERRAAA